MTPQTLLSLWRQRWNKADVAALREPLSTSGMDQWVSRVTLAAGWYFPGLGLAALGLFVLLTWLLLPVTFSLQGQIGVSALFLLASLFLRQYQGGWATLAMLGLAIITSSRYFYWRLNTTLGSALDADLLLTLLVLALELCWSALFLLSRVNQQWPLQQEVQPLPGKTEDWPKLGVYIVATGHTLEQVEQTLSAVRASAWPEKKLALYVLDLQERDDLGSLLDTSHASLLLFPEASRGAPDMVNRALAGAVQELAVVLEAGQKPATNFLERSLGWFEHDAALGLLSTPRHFLMPEPPPRWQRSFGTPDVTDEFLVLRHDIFMRTGGFPCEPTGGQPHLALDMHAKRLVYAYLGISRDTGHLVRVDTPWGQSWRARLAVYSLYERLRFYRPPLQLAVLVLPLMYLLADRLPVKADPWWLLAYGLPHLLLADLTALKLRSSARLSLLREVRELLLALFILAMTTASCLWTAAQRLWQSRQRRSWPLAALVRSVKTADIWLALLHSWAIGTATVQLLTTTDISRLNNTLFYLAWSGYILLLLLAKFAVMQEARQIAKQKTQLLSMPAMVRLSSGRTLAGHTSNFPQTSLEIVPELTAPLKLGQNLQVSIFYKFNELVFPARVNGVRQDAFTLEIDATYLPDYNSFAQACFARGADWPRWLPGRGDGSLLPVWLITVFTWPLGKVEDWLQRRKGKSIIAVTPPSHAT